MARGKARKIVSRVVGAAFLLGVIALIVVASLPKPVPVDAAEVERGVLEVTIDEAGRTRVKDRYTISAPLAGTLARIELRPGDTVEEGAVIGRVEPLAPQLLDDRSRAQAQARVAGALAAQRQARAAVSRAQAALELAEQNEARQSALAQRGGASAQSLDQARFETRARREELTSARFGVRVADYEVRMARAALGSVESGEATESMEITSPVAGRVLRVVQESEGVVQPGTPLVEVGDPAALEVVVDVLTADAVKVEPGAPVSLERWGGEGALEGRVRRVEPSAFTKVSALGVEEQRVNVVIDIDSPRERWTQLGDGYRVEARMQIWREEDALKIPASALFRSGRNGEGAAEPDAEEAEGEESEEAAGDGGWAVYVVRDGFAELVAVRVGRR
ncbi:MAG TPA: HlyD family efflux transporter periplasmic adaptor subunit, partial [Polyangiaceae bacterium LLY-WYZ-15_(1-7)]|nr:HlyD family efflux transporter periplasmic adaptor subunit [Polyangiaceae bacterium LLY-WYZ-15_(1-7)]